MEIHTNVLSIVTLKECSFVVAQLIALSTHNELCYELKLDKVLNTIAHS